MSTYENLIDDFVASRTTVDPGPDDRDHADTYRTSEHQLFEVKHDEPHAVAGWQNPGTIDAMIWIANEWRGWARRGLEDRLRESLLVVMTVVPTDDFEVGGADIIWWSAPVECMSCGIELEDSQRQFGLCPDCIGLRGNVADLFPNGSGHGIQQSRGLHGEPLPRTRPSG